MKGFSGKYSDAFRRTVAVTTTLSFVFSQQLAYALPVDGQIAAGDASIVTGDKAVDVNQSSNRAILNWRGFDVGSDERVSFHQPTDRSVTLNRVTGGGNAS